MCEQMTHRIKVTLYHRDGLGGAVVEQKPGQCLGGPLGQVFAWRLVGRMRQVQKALALARPLSQRQLQGLLLAQLAPLRRACVLLSPAKANQLRMAAKEDSETPGPLLYKLTLQLKASQARPDIHRLTG